MATVSPKYMDLIRAFALRPIKSDAELDRATAVMRKLTGPDVRLSVPESDYLSVLGDLIEAYESEHHPIEELPAHKMLAAAMEAKGVNQTELSKATGIPVSTISELLAQKRNFNVAHISKLCAYFGLTPAAFIQVDEAALA